MNETTTGMDFTQYRTFLTYVLNELLPAGGAIGQNNGEWRLIQSIPSLTSVNGRGFKSQEDLISNIVEYYVSQAQSGNVTGLNRGFSQQGAAQNKRAV